MPWPDFTELTFGYAYLRELERKYSPGGTFPLAPDFISQNSEAEKGYDVKVSLGGTVLLFIQFKRSFVLTKGNAKEVVDGTYSGPQVFRMHLHVSFKAEHAYGYVYSSEARQFDRKLRNLETWIERVRDRSRTYEENLKSLENAVKLMASGIHFRSPLSRLLRDKPIEQKAAILAYLTLDAQLTFVKL